MDCKTKINHNLVMGMLLFFCLTVSGFTVNVRADEYEYVSVAVDNRTVSFDLEERPVVVNNRTLVPLRAIGEELGASFYWNPFSGTLTVFEGGVYNILQVDNDRAIKLSENGEKGYEVIRLDVPPTIIGERLFVPVRYISESFGATVDWISDINMISIHSGNGYGIEADNSVDINSKTIISTDRYSSSEHFSDNFVKMTIKDNFMNISFKTTLDKKEWAVYLDSEESENQIGNGNLDGKGCFVANISLKGFVDGQYKLGVYLANSNDTSYVQAFDIIPLNVKDGIASFVQSPMLEHNKKASRKFLETDPSEHLDVYINKHVKDDLAKFNELFYEEEDSERKEKMMDDWTLEILSRPDSWQPASLEHLNDLTELAKRIVGDEKDEYRKIKLIHDWVAENIHYDWDSLLSTEINYYVSAHETYKTKKAICRGYAELTETLVRLTGIPCRQISGCSINQASENWSDVDHSVMNHVWNEAYVGGRWVIIDVTFDSGNKFEHGKFTIGNINYSCFDPTLETFSLSHKIMLAHEYQ